MLSDKTLPLVAATADSDSPVLVSVKLSIVKTMKQTQTDWTAPLVNMLVEVSTTSPTLGEQITTESFAIGPLQSPLDLETAYFVHAGHYYDTSLQSDLLLLLHGLD